MLVSQVGKTVKLIRSVCKELYLNRHFSILRNKKQVKCRVITGFRRAVNEVVAY